MKDVKGAFMSNRNRSFVRVAAMAGATVPRWL
jgi:hypothetical protein